MDERDLSGQPGPRGLVEQLDAHLLERGQRLDDVGGVEAEMVESLTAPGQEAPDPRRRLQRLEQLDLALARLKQGRTHVLVGDRRLLDEREPQRVAVKSVGLFQPSHDDADVVNASYPASCPLTE